MTANEDVEATIVTISGGTIRSKVGVAVGIAVVGTGVGIEVGMTEGCLEGCEGYRV